MDGQSSSQSVSIIHSLQEIVDGFFFFASLVVGEELSLGLRFLLSVHFEAIHDNSLDYNERMFNESDCLVHTLFSFFLLFVICVSDREGADTSILFVATKHVFRHDKYACHDKTFVGTKRLSQQTPVCRDKNYTCGSSCQ